MHEWLLYLATYVGIASVFRLIFSRTRIHDPLFMVINMAGCYLCFFQAEGQQRVFLIYLELIIGQYFLLVLAQKQDRPLYHWLAILVPLLNLFMVKTLMPVMPIGLSYLSFRMIYLAYEIYSERLEKFPNITNYLSFAFFPLTFLYGPISAYQRYEASIKQGYERFAPYSRCLGRILVGMIKCYLIANIVNTLSFQSYWNLSYYHGFTEFTISAIATAAYIYFNFSGICDMMIGASGLMGVQVDENFNNPFLARNLAEFWGRWHITLSRLVREVFYTPILIKIGRTTQNRFIFTLLNAMTALILFTLIGVWHGRDIGFVIFGVMHGVGVIGVNIYGVIIQHCPAAVQRVAYHRHSHIVSTAITILYVSYSAVFFGASRERIDHIFNHLVLP